jgi:hypothetical protein
MAKRRASCWEYRSIATGHERSTILLEKLRLGPRRKPEGKRLARAENEQRGGTRTLGEGMLHWRCPQDLSQTVINFRPVASSAERARVVAGPCLHTDKTSDKAKPHRQDF